jgi:hypothetical protein
MATFGPDNLTGNTSVGNGLGPRTVIVKVAKTNITQAEFDTMHEALASGGTYSGVTNDAFTIAGVRGDQAGGAFTAGTSDAVFFALQGTGTINADSSDALGVTGAALTVEVEFDQA